MFTSDDSRPSSRASFRRPGGEDDSPRQPPTSRLNQLRSTVATPQMDSKASTPIPSVFTPQLSRGTSYPFPNAESGPSSTRDPTASRPPLSTEQLNKLQARVLRAKLMDDPNALDLEDDYEQERIRSEQAGVLFNTDPVLGRKEDQKGNVVETQVLPTLDGRGRLYDVGGGKEDQEPTTNGKKRNKVDKVSHIDVSFTDSQFESHDRQGNLLRYNADDDEVTLGELVRQERFGAGAEDQKNLDAEMAANIARDTRFQVRSRECDLRLIDRTISTTKTTTPIDLPDGR